jgi:hypothetical protein
VKAPTRPSTSRAIPISSSSLTAIGQSGRCQTLVANSNAATLMYDTVRIGDSLSSVG